MSEPLSMNHARIYEGVSDKDGPLYIGLFYHGGVLLPLRFEGNGSYAVLDKMDAWLLAEREKLAKLDASMAYLRSPEAIAGRVAKAKATREAKKNQRSQEHQTT